MRILPLFALGIMAACGGTTGGYGTDAVQDVPIADASFGTILNAYRASVGENPVQYDARLNAAAQDHAQDMVDRDYFSHTTLGGTDDVQDRMIAAGYTPNAFGENIAGRQSTEDEVMTAWINSPSHDAVLKGDSFEDFGLGLAVGSESRWVLVMGREAP